MPAPEPSPDGPWDLSHGRGGASLALADDGLHLVLKRGRRALHVPYLALTHLDTSDRGLWIGTRQTTMVIRRSLFARTEGPETFVRAVGARLQAVPGGPELIERMLAIGQRARRAPPRRVTTAFAGICFAVFLLQIWFPLVMEIGSFVPALVREGELWRIVTGNFLHGFSALPVHLLVNVMCLFAFAVLVERPLGPVRTFLIMAIGALGAMLGSALAGYQEVVGASGVVAALAGAVLWLELNAADQLPAWWRLPRRMFIVVLVLQVAIDLVLPFVAGGAHLGGFAGGYLAARWVVPGAFEGRPVPLRLMRIAGLFALLTVASFVSSGQLLLREGSALERHAQRLLMVADTEAVRLNDLAWRIVTEYRPNDVQLGLAIELARRAVEQTSHADPDYLDTLAEVLFIAGDRTAALLVIDEAIRLNGDEDYFREQRRRFTGERSADDRPAPPTLPWSFRKRFGESQPAPAEPGVSI